MAVLCGMPTIQYSARGTQLYLIGGSLGPPYNVRAYKRPLAVKLANFCSKSFHHDTDRHAVFKFREIWPTRFGIRVLN